MPELTGRRDSEAQQETWLIHYGDLQFGVIAQRVGNPTGAPSWQWSCGFYPGSHPADHAKGTAETFEQARGAFEIAWRRFLEAYRGRLRRLSS